MNFSNKLPIALIGTVATIVIVQQPTVAAISTDEVGRIAKSITVLIDSKNPGSGIIIKREGNVYTVLTARHVFKEPEAKYEIVTPDGKRYLLNYSSVKKLPNVDLAVVEFTSSQTYSVAKIGNSDLATEGKAAYVAGFPKPSGAINRSIYIFIDGRITANASQPLEDGYALVYSNNTLPGMSGGPVLNESGELVGIHGKADTRPDESGIVVIKTNFNLGIPINTGLRLLASSQVDLGVKVPSAPVATGPKADDFLIQGGDNYQKGDYQGAIQALNQALQINPNYAEAYFSRGNARNELGDKQGAIADFDQALRINPNLAEAYYNRGLARYGLEDKKGAIADFDQALRINPNLAEAYNNRGIVRKELGDKQGAIADYDQALRINPNLALAYRNRGNVRNELGDKQGALSDYQKAADLYQQQGKKDDYQDALNRIRQLQNNTPTQPTSTTLLSANSSLIPGKSSVLPSDGSLYEEHTFEGRAGQSVTISVESRDFDTYVALFSPDGKLLAENDDISRSNTNSALTFTLPASGRYIVVVNAYKKGERGRYTLIIR
jgi:tetratricopeptide (TPR) repeat protein